MAADSHVEHSALASTVELVPLEALLARSDIVTIHASYESGAPPILGSPEFSVMKPGALLINTARGELVDEDSLVARAHTNLLITPHLGGATIEAMARSEQLIVAEIRRWIEARA